MLDDSVVSFSLSHASVLNKCWKEKGQHVGGDWECRFRGIGVHQRKAGVDNFHLFYDPLPA